MNYIADILIVALFCICLISGWRKGFVRTVMDLITLGAAGVGAYLLYPYPSVYMYDNIFLPKISSIIEESILSGGAGQTLAQLFNSKPAFFADTINKYSSLPEVESFYNSNRDLTLGDISRFTADPIARTLSNVLGFILMFVLLIIAIKLAAFLVDKVCRLPVLRGANTLLGIISGALLGFTAAWLAASVIAGLVPTLRASFPELVSRTVIEDSFVLKWLYHFNPVKFIQSF